MRLPLKGLFLLNIMTRFCACLGLLAALTGSAQGSDWLDWSNSEIQYLHGNGYRMPFNANPVGMSTITVTHADGWALGRNFFFMDTYFTDGGQPQQNSVYGEAYSYFTLGKILKKDLSLGIFKDIDAALGVNAGESFGSNQSGPRIFLYGASLQFNLPGFKMFTLDFLCHDQYETMPNGASLQVTPVWILPFTVAGTKWSLEGFADFIGKKNQGYAYNIIAQPQLRLDLGDLWGNSGHLYVGIEYHYWHNKYGIQGLNDAVPQALVLWKL
jgi:nucleoside-specific outer membrane channel protein Tsx